MTPKTADGFALRCALASRMCQVTACCVEQETSRPVDHFKCMKTGPRPESRDAWGPQPVSAGFVPLDSISYDGPIGRPGPSTARLRVAEFGELSTEELTMALAALEFAGPSFHPDVRRLDIMRGCSSRCGNVAGHDSTMVGAVRILQGGGSVAQAARLLLENRSSHACHGSCRRAPRPWSVPVDSPCLLSNQCGCHCAAPAPVSEPPCGNRLRAVVSLGIQSDNAVTLGHRSRFRTVLQTNTPTLARTSPMGEAVSCLGSSRAMRSPEWSTSTVIPSRCGAGARLNRGLWTEFSFGSSRCQSPPDLAASSECFRQ